MAMRAITLSGGNVGGVKNSNNNMAEPLNSCSINVNKSNHFYNVLQKFSYQNFNVTILLGGSCG